MKSLPTVASGKNFSKVIQIRLSVVERTVCRHTLLCSVFSISSYRISGCKEGKCSVWDPGGLFLRSDYCLSYRFNRVEVSNQRTQGHSRSWLAPSTFTTANLEKREIQCKWLQIFLLVKDLDGLFGKTRRDTGSSQTGSPGKLIEGQAFQTSSAIRRANGRNKGRIYATLVFWSSWNHSGFRFNLSHLICSSKWVLNSISTKASYTIGNVFEGHRTRHTGGKC